MSPRGVCVPLEIFPLFACSHKDLTMFACSLVYYDFRLCSRVLIDHSWPLGECSTVTIIYSELIEAPKREYWFNCFSLFSGAMKKPICSIVVLSSMGVPGGGAEGAAATPPPQFVGQTKPFCQFCGKFCQFCGKYAM